MTSGSVASVDPETVSSGFPFDRSGLSLQDIIATSDQVVQRMRTPSLELSVRPGGGEGACSSVNFLPKCWPLSTESGRVPAALSRPGYLRSGALLMLGLSLESERIAEAAIERRPKSGRTSLDSVVGSPRHRRPVGRSRCAGTGHSATSRRSTPPPSAGHPLGASETHRLGAKRKKTGGHGGRPLSIPTSLGGFSRRWTSDLSAPATRSVQSSGDSAHALPSWHPQMSRGRHARMIRAMSSNGSLAGAVSPTVLHTARLLVLEIATQLEGKSATAPGGMGAQVVALITALRNSEPSSNSGQAQVWGTATSGGPRTSGNTAPLARFSKPSPMADRRRWRYFVWRHRKNPRTVPD